MNLEEALRDTLEDARRSYAAWRPEVARYLFEKGLRATGEALANDPQRDDILRPLWRLQMESIGTRMFGVSTDAWRSNPAYPDRYFPILWLDLVPQLLPRLASDARMPAVVALFNLGENLVTAAPSLGGLVAEALVVAVEQIAHEGVEPVALTAMVDLGIVPPDAAPARKYGAATWTRVARLAVVDLAQWEPQIVPGAVRVEAEGTIAVADRAHDVVLQIAAAGANVQLVGRTTKAKKQEPKPLPCEVSVFGVKLSIDGDGTVMRDLREIGRIDVRGLAGAAVSPQGTIAISRRFSQRLELYVACA